MTFSFLQNMRTISTLTLLVLAFSFNHFTLNAQAPLTLSYQGVARDAAGQEWINATPTLRFTIHDQTADGEGIWTEVQTVTTNSNGLFNAQLGSVSSMAEIDWGTGNKFLQVEILEGLNFLDLGTQQFLHVPYALHSNHINVRVSVTGDSLIIGNGQALIVPGLSAANPIMPDLLPHTCGLQGVHNADITYGSVTDYDGNIYKTITVGSQEWMAENLNVSRFQNGDPIFLVQTENGWAGSILQPYSCYYQNVTANACPYGRIYNFYAITDSRGLCLVGLHVPDNSEWSLLANAFGGYSEAGVALKTTGTIEEGNGLWYSPHTANNSSGFSAVPGGYRTQYGIFSQRNSGGYYWTGQSAGSNDGFYSQLLFDNNGLSGGVFDGRAGASVRCVRNL